MLYYLIISFLLVSSPVFAGINTPYTECIGTFCTAEYLAMGSLPKINAAAAYESGFTGKGVTVAVIDGGALLSHREFAGKISDLQNSYLNPTSDFHGTHVSGTILGAKDGLGMHGVAYNATLLSFQVMLDDVISNMYTDDALEELSKDKYDHIKIINNSWGYTEYNLEDYPISPPVLSRPILAMKKIAAKDKVMVIAAGNSSKGSPALPAGLATTEDFLKHNILNVVSYDNHSAPQSPFFLAYYTNSGAGAESYTIAAPGGVQWDSNSGIYSTMDGSNDGYGFLQGTSMAAPHVSGVAALVQEAFPYMGGKQIADTILSTADKDFSTLSDKFIKTAEIRDSDGNLTGVEITHIFVTDNKSWTQAEKDAFVQEFNFGTACNTPWQSQNSVKCVEVTYTQLFGQGFLDAGAAVKGPKYLDASRLREVAYNDAEGFSAPSDYVADFSFDGSTIGQFFYTVNTLGFDSTWSHDIGEKPSAAAGFETAHVGLKKQGEGNLILTGNNTFQGVSVIEGGTLEVSGSLASDIQVNAGELFVNNGIISKKIVSFSKVSFAGMPQINSLNVNGGEIDLKTAKVNVNGVLSFNGSSILSVTIGADGHGQLTGANPTFTVSPTLNISVDKAATLSVGDAFTIFDSSAIGDVNSGLISNNLYAFERSQKGTYSATKVLAVSGFVAGQTSPSISNAADVLTGHHFNNERLENVSNILFQIAQNGTSDNLARAVSSVMPDGQAGTKNTAKETAKTVFQSLSNRISNVSGRAGGNDFGAVGMWGKYLYNHTRASDSFSGSSNGFIIGADAESNDGILAGLGYSYSDTDLKMSYDGRKIKAEAHSIFGYGQYQTETMQFEALASYAYLRSTEQKAFSDDKYTTDQVAGQIIAKQGKKSLKPTAGMRYIWAHENGRTDNLGQTILSSNSDALTAIGGISYDQNYSKKSISLGAFLTYDLISETDSIQVFLPNGLGYSVAAGRAKRLGAELSAQADLYINNDWNLSAEYTGTFKEKYQSHTGMIKVRYDF